jgi:hypothetical protein
MQKESFIINRNTPTCFDPAGSSSGRTFRYRYTDQARTAERSRLQKQRSTQSTAHSHSTIKCNLSVTITKSSPWRWPSRVETWSVLRLMIKLSLCICWWSVFLYDIVHGHGTHQCIPLNPQFFRTPSRYFLRSWRTNSRRASTFDW